MKFVVITVLFLLVLLAISFTVTQLLAFNARRRLPAEGRSARSSSFSFFPLFVFRGVYVCARCRRRSTWRSRLCAWRLSSRAR